jgi:hypothetical protein
MDTGDEAGAAAAATYFMQLFAYVLHTGDVGEWDAVTATDCGFCAKVRADVSRVYGGGGSFSGGELATDQAEVLGSDPTLGGFGVALGYEVSEGAELDAGGGVVELKPSERGMAVVDTVFGAHGWVLVGVSLRDSDS